MAGELSRNRDQEAPDAAWRALTNAFFAILEFGWPIVVALAVTPAIVYGLGPSAFGVLSLLAVTLGLFRLLDLGISGAALRAVAQYVERGELATAARVLGTVVSTYLLIGTVGCVLIVLATPVLVSTVLVIPVELRGPATIAFVASAIGFPLSLIVGAFASVPKAVQRFDLSTRVALVFSTVGPMVTVGLVVTGYGLPEIAAASVIVNLAACVVYYRVACRLLRTNRLPWRIDVSVLREMAGFGAWFIVASIGVTILYQLDKIVLGSWLSVAAVTYYVVPGGMANRIQGAVGAATQIVFPAASALLVHGRRDALIRLYRDGTRLSFLLAAGLGVPMAVFADRFLLYWLGPDFAERSTVVMVLLVATYVVLGLTGVAWGLAFGSGRAKVNALAALAMAGLDIGLLVVLVGPYEINGAALAYLLSAGIGAPLLISYVERSLLGLSGWEFLRESARVLPAVAVQAVLALALRGLAVGLVVTVGLMAIVAVALPVLYLALGLATPGDRALLAQALRRTRAVLPSRSR